MGRFKILLLAAAGALAAAAAVGVSYDQVFVGAQSAQPTVLTMSGYGLDDNPSAAAAFPGNVVVVLGTVDHYAQAHWNTNDASSPMRAIFTPVVVKVDSVLKGSAPSSITVRVFGGQVGNVVQKVTPDLVDLNDVAVGRRVLLFLGAENTIADGSRGYTVNQAFNVDQSGQVTSADLKHTISIDEFSRLVKSAGGSANP
jgi:hypothetical protein